MCRMYHISIVICNISNLYTEIQRGWLFVILDMPRHSRSLVNVLPISRPMHYGFNISTLFDFSSFPALAFHLSLDSIPHPNPVSDFHFRLSLPLFVFTHPLWHTFSKTDTMRYDLPCNHCTSQPFSSPFAHFLYLLPASCLHFLAVVQ